MTSNDTLNDLPSAADFARRLMPVGGVIHIGAGTGVGPLHQWQKWRVPFSLLIEADPNRFAWALDSAESHPDQLAISAVMSDIEGEEAFFAATNPAESGLIPAQLLQSIWPNLEVTETRNVPTRRLDTLLDKLECDISRQANWVIIDCFPSLKILKGAGHYIEQWSVLQLRVILDGASADVSGSGLTEL